MCIIGMLNVFNVLLSLGLQLGYFLQKSGKDYVIFEKNSTAGESCDDSM